METGVLGQERRSGHRAAEGGGGGGKDWKPPLDVSVVDTESLRCLLSSLQVWRALRRRPARARLVTIPSTPRPAQPSLSFSSSSWLAWLSWLSDMTGPWCCVRLSLSLSLSLCQPLLSISMENYNTNPSHREPCSTVSIH